MSELRLNPSRAALSLLAILNREDACDRREEDFDRRFDGALLIASAMADLADIRTALFSRDE